MSERKDGGAAVKYEIGMAPMGWAIIMDDNGQRSTIEVGIKSRASAEKKRRMWEKREAKAALLSARVKP